ncbi:hypothetical protein GGI1_03931 [Acidithiobacillus sp. GGI-221]|nr:hypothetical protein GGI1_03931 [Acidithiobacillus sp. GGI-221]
MPDKKTATQRRELVIMADQTDQALDHPAILFTSF